MDPTRNAGDSDTPAGGVRTTIPASDPLLADVVDSAGRMTDVVADLVAVLRADPVDLIALYCVSSRLFGHADTLAEEVDDLVPLGVNTR